MDLRGILLSSIIASCATVVAQTGLIQAEYYWDNDPGAGNGTAMVAVDGSFGQAMEQVMMQTSNLPSTGPHTLSFRVKDEDNNWGPVFTAVVDLLPGSVSFPSIDVSEGEYFWDADPGTGNGAPLLAFDGNFDSALEAVGADISSLPAIGLHTLSLRVLDANSNWGPLFQVVVEVLGGTVVFPNIHVSAAEYWVDTDPGTGAGTPMLASDGAFDQAVEKIRGGAIPVPVTDGVHVLWMRAQDDDGQWGPAFGVVVDIDTTITGTVAVEEPGVQEGAIRIGPDPTDAATGFTVFQDGAVGPMHVKILDVRGRVVLDQEFQAGSRTHIAMNGLPAGIYPVGIRIDEKTIWRSVVLR